MNQFVTRSKCNHNFDASTSFTITLTLRLCKLDCVVLMTSAHLRSDRLSGVRCSSMVQVFNLVVYIFGNSMATNLQVWHFEFVQSNDSLFKFTKALRTDAECLISVTWIQHFFWINSTPDWPIQFVTTCTHLTVWNLKLTSISLITVDFM